MSGNGDLIPMDVVGVRVELPSNQPTLDGEDVMFEFSSPNRAGVVTPVEQQDDENIMMLIMPVMLNTYA